MTNPNTAAGNQELLSWAVENIKEWNGDYTHLRSDACVEPFFTDMCYCWYIHGNNTEWVYRMLEIDNDDFCSNRIWLDVGEEFSTDTPQVITKEEWLNGVASKNAFVASQEAQQGHVHAELMAEYALVAKTNPKPWKEFEFKDPGSVNWIGCSNGTMLFQNWREYRRKPTPLKTMNIGGVIVEAWPLDHMPPCGEEFFYVSLGHECKFEVMTFYAKGRNLDYLLESKRTFSTKEQAQAVADALNLVYNRAIGKVEA